MKNPQPIDTVSSDQEFIDRFYQENRQLIIFLALQIVPGQKDAEDLAHDTIIRLMKYIPSIREIHSNKSKVASYLHAALQSEYIDQIRKKKHNHTIPVDDDILEIIIHEKKRHDFDSDRLAAKWDTQLLRERLPKMDWLLLSGKYMLGYSDQELADIYGYAPSSIRVKLGRARRKAERILSDKNEGGESRGR